MPRKRKIHVNDKNQPEAASHSKISKKEKLQKDSKDKKGTIVSSKYELQPALKDLSWKSLLGGEFKEGYMKDLQDKINEEVSNKHVIYPPQDLVFNAFNITPLQNVKVVILGQDPYIDEGQAMGLSFSVPKNLTKIPPSLKNIYKELENDKKINFKTPSHGDLTAWAENGVFLLNATLTVRAHQSNSHAAFGWQKFTDKVISLISEKCSGVVFLLWGNFAHKKEKLIDISKHKIIKTAHPSPLSFNKFLNCQCFSNVNEALNKMGKAPIDWTL